MFKLKVGDRVRLTNGESVVVGTVGNFSPTNWAIIIDGCLLANSFNPSEWGVEVLEAPFVFPKGLGAVIEETKTGDRYVYMGSRGWSSLRHAIPLSTQTMQQSWPTGWKILSEGVVDE